MYQHNITYNKTPYPCTITSTDVEREWAMCIWFSEDKRTALTVIYPSLCFFSAGTPSFSIQGIQELPVRSEVKMAEE